MKDRTGKQDLEESYEAEKRKRFAEAPDAQREDELKEKGFTLLRSELLEDGGTARTGAALQAMKSFRFSPTDRRRRLKEPIGGPLDISANDSLPALPDQNTTPEVV